METEQTEREYESALDWNPPWLAWYRRYLYFALIVSALGVLMSITVWATRTFSGALLDVVFTAFVLKSLKRLDETPVKILHMTVNGAMVLLSVIGISGFLNKVPAMIQSLLYVLAIEFNTLFSFLFAFGEQFAVVGAVTSLALALLSVYWLWKLYQFPPPYVDDRETGS